MDRSTGSATKATQVHALLADGLSQRAIARQLGMGRTSVRRMLQSRR
jgi:DNA-binding transcriptional regulator LsrR (DeoR family)